MELLLRVAIQLLKDNVIDNSEIDRNKADREFKRVTGMVDQSHIVLGNRGSVHLNYRGEAKSRVFNCSSKNDNVY